MSDEKKEYNLIDPTDPQRLWRIVIVGNKIISMVETKPKKL